MHKMYVDKINLVDHKEKVRDILDMLLCEVKDEDHELYKHVEGELYEMAYGKKLNEEIAHEWVKSMKPVGEYWSETNTTEAMNSLGYHHDAIDFYVVANMMKNDYDDITHSDDGLALKLAHDWLDDEDAKECKLYQYWKHVVKR